MASCELGAAMALREARTRREVTGELGLDGPPGRVLVVGWVPSRPGRPEGLIVVYDGGVLAPGEVAAITAQGGELAGYALGAGITSRYQASGPAGTVAGRAREGSVRLGACSRVSGLPVVRNVARYRECWCS